MLNDKIHNWLFGWLYSKDMYKYTFRSRKAMRNYGNAMVTLNYLKGLTNNDMAFFMRHIINSNR